MKKFLIIFGSLIALVLIGLFIASFFLGGIVTKGVNKFGPGITGTTVTLESAAVSPLSGSGTLNKLVVGNPPGWTSPKALSFNKIHASVVPSSLLKEYIFVNEVVIDGPEFVYETRLVTSNIKELLANIEKNMGTASSPTPETPKTKEGKPLKFAVKSFRLENAKATLGVGAAAITVPLPPIIINELGTKEGGITTDQIAAKVLGAVLREISQAAAQAASKYGAAAAGAARDAASGAASDATKKAGEGLKNIFGGKKD